MAAKKVYNTADTKIALKKLEDIFSDLQDGHIIGERDLEIPLSLSYFNSNINEKDIINITKILNSNIKLFDIYTKGKYDFSLFD
jgi:hypothetical protein